MCLSVPAQIVEILNNPTRPQAKVKCEGNSITADISLIDNPAVGDYILVHAGIGIEKYDPDEAQETIRLFEELSDILDKEQKDFI